MSVVFPWTADSDIVIADSNFYTASGYGPGSSPQFPSMPDFPGVPDLARLATPAMVSASGTTSGASQAMAAQLGLPAGTTFGTNALYVNLDLEPL